MGVARALAALLLIVPAVAGAEGPTWGFLEHQHQRGDAGDQDTHGGNGELSVPLADNAFLDVSGALIDADYADPSIARTQTYKSLRAGIGFHTRGGNDRPYVILSYASKTQIDQDLLSGAENSDHQDGGALTFGARWLAASRLSIEPGLTVARYPGRDWDGTIGLRLGLRVVRHLWLVGAYRTGETPDHDAWSAGVRVSWDDSPASSRTRPAEEGARFSAGGSIEAPQPVRLQVRPAAGAPETIVVPQGAKVQLLDSQQNQWGRWWHVKVGDAEGFIRETFLK